MDIENLKGLKNDIIFKYVFGHNKHKHILISLLNAKLNFPKDKQIVLLVNALLYSLSSFTLSHCYGRRGVSRVKNLLPPQTLY